jgi:hypothetical protein
MARFAWEHVGKERESRVSELTAIAQCASAFEALFPGRLGAVEKEAAIETVLAEFARLAQSDKMVERITRQASYVASDLSRGIVRDILAALFRGTGVTP